MATENDELEKRNYQAFFIQKKLSRETVDRIMRFAELMLSHPYNLRHTDHSFSSDQMTNFEEEYKRLETEFSSMLPPDVVLSMIQSLKGFDQPII